jgi:hypothetical protein
MAYLNGLYPLLVGASATGSALDWPGGRGAFWLKDGTIGTATVKLQWSGDDGTTWIDADQGGDTNATFTAVGKMGNFDLPPGKLRANVSGSGMSALNAQVIAVPR